MQEERDQQTHSAAQPQRTARSNRLASLRRTLWPTCLCSSARDNELPEAYTVAAASSTTDATAAQPTVVEPEHIVMATTATTVTSSCDVVDDGLVTIRMTGGGPYGFRLSDSSAGTLVVGKLRKRGRADEAGLREGDVLMSVNGKTCQGLSCTQAMDLVDTSGQSLVIRVSRGGTSRSTVSRTTSQQEPSATATRCHSVQDRHGQTIYVPSTDPINASEVFASSSASPMSSSSTSATVSPHTAPVRQLPADTSPSSGRGTSTSSAVSSRSSLHARDTELRGDTQLERGGKLTVSAPKGVDVSEEDTGDGGRTFTLTFGLEVGDGGSSTVVRQTTTTTSRTVTSSASASGAQPLVWQPQQQQQQEASRQSDSTPGVTATTCTSRPPLAKILQESTDQDSPATPTSPDARTKKMFIDSAFYDDPEHKYPTVEEQIALARRVAMSVFAPANANSRGHKMFMRSRERSVRWEAGYKPPESDSDPRPEEKYFRPEPWAPGAGGGGAGAPAESASSPPPLASPSSATLPLTSFVFAPKLPSADKMDKERLDALSSEEFDRVMMQDKKSTHTNVGPQVCFNLAEGLKNMKGRGGQLFAKRQAKAESWAVGGESVDEPGDQSPAAAADPTATSNASILLKDGHQQQQPASQPAGRTVSSMPINRLKEMVEMPRPAMSPWDAAAQYGTVDPAFTHLDQSPSPSLSPAAAAAAGASKRESSAASAGGRVKSWAASNPDAAAGLAAAMTSSLHAKTVASDAKATSLTTASAASPGFQSLKFSTPSTTSGATSEPSDDPQRRLAAAVGGGV